MALHESSLGRVIKLRGEALSDEGRFSARERHPCGYDGRWSAGSCATSSRAPSWALGTLLEARFGSLQLEPFQEVALPLGQLNAALQLVSEFGLTEVIGEGDDLHACCSGSRSGQPRGEA